MTAHTEVDVTRQHLTSVTVIDRNGELGLPDEVVVHTDHARITLPDPIGLWEALTDSLRAEHGDHMTTWLTNPHGQPEGRLCTVYTSASDMWCAQPAGDTGRCERHERRAS